MFATCQQTQVAGRAARPSASGRVSRHQAARCKTVSSWKQQQRVALPRVRCAPRLRGINPAKAPRRSPRRPPPTTQTAHLASADVPLLPLFSPSSPAATPAASTRLAPSPRPPRPPRVPAKWSARPVPQREIDLNDPEEAASSSRLATSPSSSPSSPTKLARPTSESSVSREKCTGRGISSSPRRSTAPRCRRWRARCGIISTRTTACSSPRT